MREDRVRLAPAPQAGQIEMHADRRAAPVRRTPDIGHHRAARLECRQMDRLAIEDLRILAHQQRIAVPAHRSRPRAEGIAFQSLCSARRWPGEHRLARAEAPIGLLQRDDVGIDLAQYLQRALRPAPPISADRLTHVVAGDLDHVRPLSRGRGSGQGVTAPMRLAAGLVAAASSAAASKPASGDFGGVQASSRSQLHWGRRAALFPARRTRPP